MPISEEPVLSDDRRSDEASTLRAFFDEQLHYLQHLVSRLHTHIHDEQQQAEDDKKIVESFVDASNSKMRAVHGYSHKLRVHVRALYNHVLQIAAQIPPPVDLNLEAFESNPLVNALFVNSKDLDKLVQTDPEVAVYLRSHSKSVLYALLTACKSEKRTLGVAMLGDMLIREVPQQAVNFSAHKIHILCASPAELNAALKMYLFGHAVALVKQEMRSRMPLQAFNQAFNARDDSYELRVNSLANPDIYLAELIEYIKIPDQLLRIDKSHFRLSKLGIKLDSGDTQSANEFVIHELIWSNNSKNVVLQVTLAP